MFVWFALVTRHHFAPQSEREHNCSSNYQDLHHIHCEWMMRKVPKQNTPLSFETRERKTLGCRRSEQCVIFEKKNKQN